MSKQDWNKAVELIREAIERGEIVTDLTPQEYLAQSIYGERKPDKPEPRER